MAPILLTVNDVYGDSTDTGRVYEYYIGIIPQEQTIEVQVFEISDLRYYSAIVATLVLSLLASTYCVFQTSSAVIKPLANLNQRMNEILQEDNFNDFNLDSKDGKCKEIMDLQDQFSELISDYKFTQNEFLKQESDVIALIDLAQACVLFSGQNYQLGAGQLNQLY